MPLSRRNKGEPNREPVLSKKEGFKGDSFPVDIGPTPTEEGATPEAPGVVDVVINPPVIVVDGKDKDKDKDPKDPKKDK